MDNNVFFKGKAIIDEQFNILSVDDELKDFLGDNLVNTKIARLIHPSDINQLETAVKNVQSESGFVTALRMVDNTGRYRWFVYIIDEAEPADNVCNSRICSISIFDIRVFFKHTDTKADNTYMEYFSLMEYLMFSYDVSTDRLRIFMMESHQQVDFYRGTLADWRRTMLANGNVYGVTRNIFDSFCDDFANGTEIFEREFKMKIFENSQGMEWCLVKGKTIIDFNGKKHVIATMSKISPVNDEEHVYLNSDALDVGTDILNKRAITEYTKRLIESKPGCPVTIAIIDIDNFKTINDEFGHMFGDEVICNVADVIKESTMPGIQDLKKAHVSNTVMLTGDHSTVARDIASKIGIDQVYSDLLPQDKVTQLEKLMGNDHVVAFVGDGINDAPVLARSDIGIAMGGVGSDVAIEAADVVLMSDDITSIAKAIQVSHYTNFILKENVTFTLLIKIGVLVLTLFGLTNMWMGVFADVGVTLIAICNSMRILYKKS